ncbi:MAG: hypothetical protein ACHP84_16355 [Caulobacterales bacterium]
MLKRQFRVLAGAAVVAIAAVAHPARADIRIFSYDPADERTEGASGPLTFEFKQRLLFTTIIRVFSTQGHAMANLKPVEDGALGHGGIAAIVPAARERDLYEVLDTAEGDDLIHAFCPGSKRAWMAFGKVREGQDLTVRVLGDTPAGGRAHLCQTLSFNYHGEWHLPAAQHIRDSDFLRPRLPN